MDEPIQGTNVEDVLEASIAVIQRLQSNQGCLFLFSSHLIELDEEFAPAMRIIRCCFVAREPEGRLEYDYLIRLGVAGLRVLTEQGVFALLDDR